MNNPIDIVFTGRYIAGHAEVRALNALAFERFGEELQEPYIFDLWLKNNVLAYN